MLLVSFICIIYDMFGDGIMKEMIEERIKKYVDDDVPIMVLFYTDVECGRQYGGLCFDSRKGSIEMNDDYVWVCTEDDETFMKWNNVICVHIEML